MASTRLEKGPAADVRAHPHPGIGPQVVGIDRHRLAPADPPAAEGHKDDHQRADGVKVNHGIQRQAAQILGRGIAQFVGRPGMRKLVDADRDHQGGQDRII